MTQWGLDTLFNPAKRHMDDEKRRLQSTREEVGDASGGKRIDLESGKVRIPKVENDEDETTTESGRAETKPKRAKSHEKSKDKGEPSAAAVRAAQRRGRKI